ncbi:Ionotropic glutamate receptor, metazoa, Periplasmic binding protein-like I [Heracleum sosnowskyi]|uniref:Ionotropic glutamate receptor, metazoa, Periplasmic binding protein-like I n=1 Tax=Heracleum sosnowskyi TaxID=360622 RepID=A0AAD8IW81_9APIA|nr:Ionotropic glutamate receptor, metazoa, Periplasmic binding protein-like I [Heracleum sosnowskyi]
MNATVGYCKGSLFLKSYMISALGFPETKINKYNSTYAYAEALNNKTIAGIFLEVPPAKVFLAQYCKSFTKTEKTFKVGGFGFAFKKNFSMLPDINKAIMSITENGTLLDLENQYI